MARRTWSTLPLTDRRTAAGDYGSTWYIRRLGSSSRVTTGLESLVIAFPV
jgi:hypothetical protein